jgi:hypothetical protein
MAVNGQQQASVAWLAVVSFPSTHWLVEWVGAQSPSGRSGLEKSFLSLPGMVRDSSMILP